MCGEGNSYPLQNSCLENPTDRGDWQVIVHWVAKSWTLLNDIHSLTREACESWTTKKAECRKMDAFKSWCWRRLLRVFWIARRSNQSILKEIKPDYSLEGLLLKLRPQNFGHLMWRGDSLEMTLMLGKTEGKRGRRQLMMRGLDSITDSMDMNLSKLREPGKSYGQRILMGYSPWGCKSQTQLSD